MEAKLPDLSDDPIEAAVQLQTNMPKWLAEHYKEAVKTVTRKKD